MVRWGHTIRSIRGQPDCHVNIIDPVALATTPRDLLMQCSSNQQQVFQAVQEKLVVLFMIYFLQFFFLGGGGPAACMQVPMDARRGRWIP